MGWAFGFIRSGYLVKYVVSGKVIEKGEKKPVADWIVPSGATVKALHATQEEASENLD